MPVDHGERDVAAGQASGALWLVRHARPLVEPGICYGATDMPADATATQSCALALVQVLPVHARVFTSPLQRCTQLAQAVQRLRPELDIEPDARLVEMDFGAWEGWRWDDIPKAAIDAWTRDFVHTRFGGRERVQQLMQRVDAMRNFSCTLGTPVVWLTHAGVIRAATLLLERRTHLQRADQWPVDGPEFGAWTIQSCGPFRPPRFTLRSVSNKVAT